ncbi:MAG: SDR family oxidoreductase [Burkholderiales bacterium]|nr:SDR family oxidoreductase [Burkholderiales bacterium]
MRILITGGFAFIGGRVARHLQHAGHQIILGSRKAVVSPPDWLPQAQVVRIDWNDVHALEKICTGIDVVIQAAGMNAQDSAADPVAALEANGLGTARLVSAASRVRVKRFIYLSTAHVYASPLVGIVTEDTCARNLHPYATSHFAGENAVLGASQCLQIEGIVLRLSNAFGVPAHKDVNCWLLLVNDLCRQAVQTRELVLRSNGLQRRDFVAMPEVCCAIDDLCSFNFGSDVPGIFNVGSGMSQTVLEMAHLIQQRCKLALGYEPALRRCEANGDQKHEMLVYRSDKLARMGVRIGVDKSGEIDRLLTFCQDTYGTISSGRE